MWINRIIATVLQITRVKFTNVLCIVQKWQCSMQFILVILLILISLRMRRGLQEMRMQSGTNWCWKHCCILSYILVSKICCGSNKMEHLLTQQKFPCKSSGQRFRAVSFLVSRTSRGPPARLTVLYQTTYPGAALKVRYMKHVLPLFWLKKAHSGVYTRNPQGNATTCQDSLSIATAGVYWTTWWSPTKCHIQIIMTEMNSHGHGMQPIVLIKIF
jgi:hypothetical protein